MVFQCSGWMAGRHAEPVRDLGRDLDVETVPGAGLHVVPRLRLVLRVGRDAELPEEQTSASASPVVVSAEAHTPVPLPPDGAAADVEVSLEHAAPIMARTARPARATRGRNLIMRSLLRGPAEMRARMLGRTIGPCRRPGNAIDPRGPSTACTLARPGRDGGTGRRAGLKIPCPKGRAGSTPAPGTRQIPHPRASSAARATTRSS